MHVCIRPIAVISHGCEGAAVRRLWLLIATPLLGSCVTGNSTVFTGNPTSLQKMIVVARTCGVKQLRVEGPPSHCSDCASTDIWLRVVPSSGSRDAAARQCLMKWFQNEALSDVFLTVEARE